MVCHGECFAENWEEALSKGLSGQDRIYVLAFGWPHSVDACFELKEGESHKDYKDVNFDNQWVHPESRNFIKKWWRDRKFEDAKKRGRP